MNIVIKRIYDYIQTKDANGKITKLFYQNFWLKPDKRRCVGQTLYTRIILTNRAIHVYELDLRKGRCKRTLKRVASYPLTRFKSGYAFVGLRNTDDQYTHLQIDMVKDDAVARCADGVHDFQIVIFSISPYGDRNFMLDNCDIFVNENSQFRQNEDIVKGDPKSHYDYCMKYIPFEYELHQADGEVFLSLWRFNTFMVNGWRYFSNSDYYRQICSSETKCAIWWSAVDIWSVNTQFDGAALMWEIDDERKIEIVRC